MVRKLKFHEQKLLKKVDFISWEPSVDNSAHENQIMRIYAIDKREHYTLYNQLSKEVREMAKRIRDLNDRNPNKLRLARRLLGKLYDFGLIPTADTLERADKVTASSFCRRRLPVVMKKIGMVQRTQDAKKFVEQGHVRVGIELVTDPAFLVTRAQSDVLTWARASKLKAHVAQYNNERDDFDDFN